MDFYKRAFGATELFRLVAPSGEIAHAETKIGDSPLMLAAPEEEGGFRSPELLGGSSVGLQVYVEDVEDVDALFTRPSPRGAKVIRLLQDQFYRERTGTLEDPFGHVWFLATHKEDLSGE